MKKTFDAYADPGHGWVKVPLRVLDELRISDKITSWSYRRGNHAYLEEDRDATTFCNAFFAKHGEDPKFRFHHGNRRSRIRGYENYRQMSLELA